MENQTHDQSGEKIKDLEEKIRRQQEEKVEFRIKTLQDEMKDETNSLKQQMKETEGSLEKKMKWYLNIAFGAVAFCAFLLSYFGREQIDKEVSKAMSTYAKAKMDSLIGKVKQNSDSINARGEALLEEVREQMKERSEKAIVTTVEEMRQKYPELIAELNNKNFTPDKPISIDVKRDLNQANKMLKKIKKEPQYSFDDWYYKGVAEYDKNDRDKALKSFTEALNKNPNSADAYRYRGNIYSDSKQYDKAIADYNKAIDLRANAVTYYNRGVSYYSLKQYQEAISDYNNAIRFNSNYAKAYNNRGLSYFALQEYKKAIDDYSKAIQYESNYAMAYHNRAVAYDASNKKDKAKKDYDKAKQLDPQNYR